MPRLTIVIPCLSRGEPFEDTLASVLQNRPTGCEVLVIHPGPYEDPYDLKDEVCFVETDPDACLRELINLGFVHAEGDLVHILQCGMQVQDGWTETAVRHFDDPAVGAVSPLVLIPHRRARPAVAGVAYRVGGRRRLWRTEVTPKRHHRRSVVGPTLSAGFYRKNAVREIGGVDPTIGDALADVDLGLSLRAAGYLAVCEPESQVSGPMPNDGPRGFDEALRAERLFWKHAPAHGWLRSLVTHIPVVVADVAVLFPRGFARLLGRCTAWLQLPFRRRSVRPLTSPSAAPHFDTGGHRLDEAHACGQRSAQPAGRGNRLPECASGLSHWI